jgi:nicotinamide riboside kinase
VITIAITGPESTGKTSISEYLALAFNGIWIPEYARHYMKKINRPYTFEDIIKIGITQINQRKEAETKEPDFIFLDTWLIITKIWFLEVFKKCPHWIDEAIVNNPVDLYLLCEPDIPWIPDPLRENGEEKRKYLFERYLNEIIKTGVPYELVSGTEEFRNLNARSKVKMHFSH